MALSQLSDRQLLNLFLTTHKNELTPRGRGILDELMQRGIFLDVRRREFLTGEQWKLRYGEDPPAPADYVVYLQRNAKQSAELQ